jgi:hypothetical protein
MKREYAEALLEIVCPTSRDLWSYGLTGMEPAEYCLEVIARHNLEEYDNEDKFEGVKHFDYLEVEE